MPYGPGAMGVIFALGIAGIFAVLLALFIAALFLWLAAKLIGIRDASIGKAMVAILGGGLLAVIIGAIAGTLLGPLGPILAFVINIWVIKVVFNTDWLRAFLAWLFSGIIVVLVAGILVLLGLFTIGALSSL